MCLWLMAVASNSDLYESTQQIYCNKQHFMESQHGNEGLLRVLKAYWGADEAGEHFPLSVPPWKTGGLSLSLRLTVTSSSVLVLKHPDCSCFPDCPDSRNEDGRMHLFCALAEVQQMSSDRTGRMKYSMMYYWWWYCIFLLFLEKVWIEDVSIYSFCLHHIRQLLYYPSAGLLLSGSHERARKRRLSAFGFAIFMVISAKETPLISTPSPSPMTLPQLLAQVQTSRSGRRQPHEQHVCQIGFRAAVLITPCCATVTKSTISASELQSWIRPLSKLLVWHFCFAKLIVWTVPE